MADKIKVILNSYGGRLGSQAKITLVEQAMQAAGLDGDACRLLPHGEHLHHFRQAHLGQFALDAAQLAGQSGLLAHRFLLAQDPEYATGHLRRTHILGDNFLSSILQGGHPG